ncbi:tetratricopeptide repeat protein [Teladorsagia circumcincta]|uniref:Tetratricopeptide repeat protein n=1 Tax=Teladorsagia circumcincta TaxID=45464 RepID=A0A2G9UXZ0_TELCI|nr:tetratricopeptide repeat protein [Teladorsagia circumcincta]
MHWRASWQRTGRKNTPLVSSTCSTANNPFLTSAQPMMEGDRLMQEGDLGNAMLAYEAAVQKNPNDAEIDRALQQNLERLVEAVEENSIDANVGITYRYLVEMQWAWCRLGLSHAENEHDAKAIAAFNKCLQIQPNNEEVEERFLSAARQQTGTGDADLQNALGILYNLSRNYERAVECIKLAIASRPEDARLWNRLGATLANGDRTPEAVAAYREALKRYPLYVRARYNLGISCLHLNSYR